jgi:hypothetical protein
MRKLLLAAVAFCIAAPAFAADMATKAPPYQFGGPYPVNGCGLYYGINALASAAPIADATPGATAIGGDIGGTLGYTCSFNGGSNFWFVEGIGDFQNLNGSGPGFGFSGPAHFEERFAVGGPISNLLGILPNLNLPAVPALPALPNGITASNSNGYIYGAVNQDDISAYFGLANNREWIFSPEAGLGLLTRLSNNVVVDTWAGVRIQGEGICLGNTNMCPKLSTGVVTGLALKY